MHFLHGPGEPKVVGRKGQRVVGRAEIATRGCQALAMKSSGLLENPNLREMKLGMRKMLRKGRFKVLENCSRLVLLVSSSSIAYVSLKCAIYES